MLINYKALTTTKFVLLSMLSIVLIGTGNIAHHLFEAFYKQGITIAQVYGRNTKTLSSFKSKCTTTTDPTKIIDANLYIIAVSDTAIESLSKLISDKKGLVVHTSGSVPIYALSAKRKGVLYPLQSFTKEKEIDFSTVPLCIEASHKDDLAVLKKLANTISKSVFEVSSIQRAQIHLAAVFANNFSNHMYTIANELCKKEGLPFDLLKPLIMESTAKLQVLKPDKAQTGPAIRNDILTMQSHIDSLENPLYKKIYQLISESIKTKNEEKL